MSSIAAQVPEPMPVVTPIRDARYVQPRQLEPAERRPEPRDETPIEYVAVLGEK